MSISILPRNAVTCKLLDDGWRLNYLYPRFATVTRPDGSRHCSYIGFDDLNTAQSYLETLSQNYKAELRTGQRLETCYEIKVWGLSTEASFEVLRQLYRKA
ncbi:hypothetical protein C7H19_23810 [Aphanothece hegewaldii CCALA 016]|uniref:Uncharacterized protein n=1 Tax=Aphanothece hegewaldii CCALA 016 TaxID=2107694 RepID=A0A2T1LR90_9CHRO|nr:hypothetical protein [Aphanothece hegewaldii]PSF30493.1 hypothetical protein C7H19_23810 [Aphanothece hegewaldii CCALA 016]